MKEKLLRQEVRKALHELMQQMHPTHPINGGNNQFPYHKEDDIVKLPHDIDTKEDYLINWEEYSENHDLYGFPMKEFKKGLQVEKAKKSNFSIIDVAQIVINNLQENPQYYSNLGV